MTPGRASPAKRIARLHLGLGSFLAHSFVILLLLEHERAVALARWDGRGGGPRRLAAASNGPHVLPASSGPHVLAAASDGLGRRIGPLAAAAGRRAMLGLRLKSVGERRGRLTYGGRGLQTSSLSSEFRRGKGRNFIAKDEDPLHKAELWRRQPCEWCNGLPDGYHADIHAHPPCSGYFRCFNQRLAEVGPCAAGRFYSKAKGRCVDSYRESTCASLPSRGEGAGGVRTGAGAGAVDVFEGSTQRRALLRQIAPNQGRMVYSDGVHWSEVNALLEFKRVNIDMYDNLASWQVPRAINHSATDGASGSKTSRSMAKQSTRPKHFVCRWKGITCSPPSWHVTNISLPRCSLWGNQSIGQSLPPRWGNLTALVHIDLGYNVGSDQVTGLLGTIPSEFGSLSRLTHLDLNGNKLLGSLPESLSSLRRLKSLILASNSFSGALPSAGLKGLSSLEILSLNSNNFSGSIPESLGSLSSLVDLNLQGNVNMEGRIPDALSNLTRLTLLSLNSLGLEGSLPRWLGALKMMASLDLGGNKLTGTLPLSLGSLTNLLEVSLNANELTGPVPPKLVQKLCAIPTLSSFQATNNKLSGPFPAEAFLEPPCQAFAMGNFDLSYNAVTGTIPAGFFPSVTIGTLGLVNNQLSGALPRDLFMNPYSSGVYLSGNNFTGALPRLVCDTALGGGIAIFGDVYLGGNSLSGGLSGFITPQTVKTCGTAMALRIDLHSNALTGPLPASVWALTNLIELNVAENGLTGEIPVPAPLCSPATIARRVEGELALSLNMSGNALSGPLPKLFGNCTDATTMDFSSNRLSGSLPDQIGGIGLSISDLRLGKNEFSGWIPGRAIRQLQGLAILDLSANNFSGEFPTELSELPRLASLDASGNSISGSIPSSLFSLRNLRNLSLANNLFSSSIPQSLAPPNMPLLTFLDLSSNDLSGPIPAGFANIFVTPPVFLNFSYNNLSGAFPGGNLSSLPPSSFEGNSYMCGGAGYPACPEPPSSSSLSPGAIAGIVIAAAVVLVLIVFLAWWFLRSRDAWAGGRMMVFEKLDFNLTIRDILNATENFDEKYQLGRGGFGTVYRATLLDGRTVAIKRLAAGSAQGEREVRAEIETLGNIRHRNLVKLVAAFIGPPPANERLLLYNFLPGGSLDVVFGKELPKESPLRRWDLRRRIALDTARGMKYLHHDCTPLIIHRDMKPANVLLDDQLVAHVADFGLAREIDLTKSHMSTAVFGTIGYIAPEYARRGRLSFKSDVFAYGVLLLQLITGRQPSDEEVAERGLHRWVTASSVSAVVDPQMDDAMDGNNADQIKAAIQLGVLCTARVAADRPSMAEVVHLLENLGEFARGMQRTTSVAVQNTT